MKCFPVALFCLLLVTSCGREEILLSTCDPPDSFDHIDTLNVRKADTLPYQLTLTESNFIEAKIDGTLETFDIRGVENESDYNRCFDRGNGPYCFFGMFSAQTGISARIDFGPIDADAIQTPLLIDESSSSMGTFITRYEDVNFDTIRVEGNTTDGLKIVIDHYDGRAISGTFSGTGHSTLNSVTVNDQVEIIEGSFFVDLAKNNFTRSQRFLGLSSDGEDSFVMPNSYVELQEGVALVVNTDEDKNVFFHQSTESTNDVLTGITLVFEIPDASNSFIIGGDALGNYQTFLFRESNIYSFDQFQSVNEGTISGYLCDGNWYFDFDLEVDVLHESVDLITYRLIDQLVVPEILE